MTATGYKGVADAIATTLGGIAKRQTLENPSSGSYYVQLPNGSDAVPLAISREEPPSHHAFFRHGDAPSRIHGHGRSLPAERCA